MKKLMMLGMMVFSCSSLWAKHRTTLNADNLLFGTVNNARLDPSSVTLQGNNFNLSPTSITMQGNNFILNPSSVTFQGNAFNGANQLIKADGSGLVSNVDLDPSSVTKQGNAFNGANQLIQADGNGLVNNTDLDNSSITKRGQLSDGSQSLDLASIVIRTSLNTVNYGADFSASSISISNGANLSFVNLSGGANAWNAMHMGSSDQIRFFEVGTEFGSYLFGNGAKVGLGITNTAPESTVYVVPAYFYGRGRGAGLLINLRDTGSGFFEVTSTSITANSSMTVTGKMTSGGGFVGDGSGLTNLPASGGGDPTVITTFTKTFSIPGDITISTFTFDPMGTGWEISRTTITIVGITFSVEASSVGSTIGSVSVTTGTNITQYSSIYMASFTAVSNNNYSISTTSPIVPTTSIIYPNSRLAVQIPSAPVSGQAPRNAKFTMEYFSWKK